MKPKFNFVVCHLMVMEVKKMLMRYFFGWLRYCSFVL